SASIMVAPRSPSMDATSDFPQAMFPVRPITYGRRSGIASCLGLAVQLVGQLCPLLVDLIELILSGLILLTDLSDSFDVARHARGLELLAQFVEASFQPDDILFEGIHPLP